MTKIMGADRQHIAYNDGELTLFGIRGQIIDGVAYTSDPEMFTYCPHMTRETAPLRPYQADLGEARKRLTDPMLRSWDDPSTTAYIDAAHAVNLFLEGVLTPENIASAYEDKWGNVIFPRKRLYGLRVTIHVFDSGPLSARYAKLGGLPGVCQACTERFIDELDSSSEIVGRMIAYLETWRTLAQHASGIYVKSTADDVPVPPDTIALISDTSREKLRTLQSTFDLLPLLKR